MSEYVLKCCDVYVGNESRSQCFRSETGSLYTQKQALRFPSAAFARLVRTKVGCSYAGRTKVVRLIPKPIVFKPGQFVQTRSCSFGMVLGQWAHLAIGPRCSDNGDTPIIYQDGSGEWITASDLTIATYEEFIR